MTNQSGLGKVPTNVSVQPTKMQQFFAKIKIRSLFSYFNTSSTELDYKFVGRRFIYEESLLMTHDKPETEANKTIATMNSKELELKLKDFFSELLDSKAVNILTFILILSYSVLHAIEFNNIYKTNAYLFNMIEMALISFLTVEVFLRLYSSIDVFFLSLWNIFDLVFTALAIWTINYKYICIFKLINLLHSWTLLNMLSCIKYLRTTLRDGLVVILKTATESIPDVFPIVIILTMSLLIFSVNLVYINFNSRNKNFEDIPAAMYSLFTVMSLDGIWIMIKNMMFENNVDRSFTLLIILCTFFFGKCILCNIIVAIMTSNLIDSLVGENSMNKSREESDVKILISFDILRKKLATYSQTPIQNAKLTNLDWQTIRTYNLLLIALEDNFLEYKNLKTDLEKIIEVIKDIEINMNFKNSYIDL